MNETVPIGLLTAEGFDISTVLRRHAEDVVIDAASGMRCLPASLVRSMIAERDAAAQAERELAAARRAEAKPHAVRERIRRLKALQSQVDAPSGPVTAGMALASLQAIDGTADERLDASARQFDELVTGRLQYHSINERR
jgi:hypothetical protein